MILNVFEKSACFICFLTMFSRSFVPRGHLLPWSCYIDFTNAVHTGGPTFSPSTLALSELAVEQDMQDNLLRSLPVTL